MLADKLLEQVDHLVDACARAETCQAMAHLATTDAERANLAARVEYWQAQVSDRRAHLTAALNSALPPTTYTTPDPTAPVRVTQDGDIELRGVLDRGARAVSIRLSPVQAVAIAATMIACAAVRVDRSGGRLSEVLPPITRH